MLVPVAGATPTGLPVRTAGLPVRPASPALARKAPSVPDGRVLIGFGQRYFAQQPSV
jgi:hypothetical protein